MRILGIDPGYALVGWAVVDYDQARQYKLVDCGVISTDKGLDIYTRLSEIASDIVDLVQEYKPDLAGIETLLFSKNVTTAMKVSESRGVILLELHRAGVEIVQVNPMQVKTSVTGYGKAKKTQIQESVRILCGLESIPKPDDAADAVAVAITAYDLHKTAKLRES